MCILWLELQVSDEISVETSSQRIAWSEFVLFSVIWEYIYTLLSIVGQEYSVIELVGIACFRFWIWNELRVMQIRSTFVFHCSFS